MLSVQPTPATPVHSLALPASRTRQSFFLLRWALGLALLAAALLPGLARAVPVTLDVSAGDITIDTTALTYSSGGASGSYTAADNFIIQGTTTAYTVAVSGTGSADITLNGASIDLSAATATLCAFCITDSATVNLTLVGVNTLTSVHVSGLIYPAGLGAPAGTTLVIGGAGSLTATGSGTYSAGIGGGYNQSGGDITINGGTITAACGGSASGGAGIGGGSGTGGGNGGTITINDGTVTATSYMGAGIGGGSGIGGTGGSITIAGGTVTATSSGQGAGIGGGAGGAGGTIKITGGTVQATATTAAAGIGGGNGGAGGVITISGGDDVTAQGGVSGAGIGGGQVSTGGTITISGGTVNAIGGSNSAGIGGGGGGSTGSGGSITISGGTVTATSGSGYGAGIGGATNSASGDITISGGTVTATALGYGAGIGSGGGISSTVDNITITGDASVNATGGSSGSFSGAAGIGSGVAGSFAAPAAAGMIVIDTTGTVIATGGSSPMANGAPIGQGSGYISPNYVSGAGIAPVTDPTDQSAVTNDNASFSITVTPVGATLPTVTYQWQQSTDGATWTNAAGASATTDTLNLAGVTTGMSGYQYRAVVTVTNVGAASSITYTTHAATLTVAAIVITITTQPAAATAVTQGAISGSLNVAASVSTGGGTPTYLWYSNTTNSNSGGTPIGGATGTSFTIPTTLAAGTYYYYCVVSATGAPDMASSVAVVTVNAAVIAPVIIAPLGGALTGGTVGMGYSATLAASGTAPITWALASGSSLPPGLTLNGTTGQISGTPTTAGPYSFSITASNGAGNDTAAFSIQILPAAAGQPAAAVPTLDAAALAALALALAGLAGLGRKRRQP